MTDAAATGATTTTATGDSGAGGQTTTTTTAPLNATQGGTSTTAGQAAFTVPAEILDWGANKGYDKAEMTKLYTDNPNVYKLATSYRDAEKLLGQQNGGDRLQMPKDVSNFADVVPALERLGAPKDATGYKLDIPASGDSKFAESVSQWFAEAKLLPHQAQVINQKYNEFASAMQKDIAQKDADDGRASVDALAKEWGTDEKVNSEKASLGFNKLAKDIGMTPERMEEIKSGNSVKLSASEFAKLSKAYGEASKVGGDKFIGDDGNQGGTNMGAETAKAEHARKLSDPAFAQRYLKKDSAAVKEIRDLEAIMAKANPNLQLGN